MARYDYRCTSCNQVFEVEHGMLEHPDVFCPTCGAAAEKVFNASGIEFKGSGFYNTDQRGGATTTKSTSAPASESHQESHTCENCPHKKE